MRHNSYGTGITDIGYRYRYSTVLSGNIWQELEPESEPKLWTYVEPESEPKINNFGSATLKKINLYGTDTVPTRYRCVLTVKNPKTEHSKCSATSFKKISKQNFVV